MTRYTSIPIAILLFLCLADMPYGYYQFVRLASAVFFMAVALDESKHHRKGLASIFFGLAILFQPLIKIPLGRDLWNMVDVIVGIGLLGYAGVAGRK